MNIGKVKGNIFGLGIFGREVDFLVRGSTVRS